MHRRRGAHFCDATQCRTTQGDPARDADLCADRMMMAIDRYCLYTAKTNKDDSATVEPEASADQASHAAIDMVKQNVKRLVSLGAQQAGFFIHDCNRDGFLFYQLSRGAVGDIAPDREVVGVSGMRPGFY